LLACYLSPMHAFKGRVSNGRLVLDEPTDLPEGTVVPLAIADEWDDLDSDERARLRAALDDAIASVGAGRTIDGDELLRRLLARP
jgi:hypothetical protein